MNHFVGLYLAEYSKLSISFLVQFCVENLLKTKKFRSLPIDWPVDDLLWQFWQCKLIDSSNDFLGNVEF